MVYFLPSDIARLVLGYLQDQHYQKTYKCFLKECPHLQEYCALLKTGVDLSAAPFGFHNLLVILDEWAKFKGNEYSPGNTSERRQDSVHQREQQHASSKQRFDRKQNDRFQQTAPYHSGSRESGRRVSGVTIQDTPKIRGRAVNRGTSLISKDGWQVDSDASSDLSDSHTIDSDNQNCFERRISPHSNVLVNRSKSCQNISSSNKTVLSRRPAKQPSHVAFSDRGSSDIEIIDPEPRVTHPKLTNLLSVPNQESESCARTNHQSKTATVSSGIKLAPNFKAMCSSRAISPRNKQNSSEISSNIALNQSCNANSNSKPSSIRPVVPLQEDRDCSVNKNGSPLQTGDACSVITPKSDNAGVVQTSSLKSTPNKVGSDHKVTNGEGVLPVTTMACLDSAKKCLIWISAITPIPENCEISTAENVTGKRSDKNTSVTEETKNKLKVKINSPPDPVRKKLHDLKTRKKDGNTSEECRIEVSLPDTIHDGEHAGLEVNGNNKQPECEGINNSGEVDVQNKSDHDTSKDSSGKNSDSTDSTSGNSSLEKTNEKSEGHGCSEITRRDNREKTEDIVIHSSEFNKCDTESKIVTSSCMLIDTKNKNVTSASINKNQGSPIDKLDHSKELNKKVIFYKGKDGKFHRSPEMTTESVEDYIESTVATCRHDAEDKKHLHQSCNDHGSKPRQTCDTNKDNKKNSKGVDKIDANDIDENDIPRTKKNFDVESSERDRRKCIGNEKVSHGSIEEGMKKVRNHTDGDSDHVVKENEPVEHETPGSLHEADSSAAPVVSAGNATSILKCQAGPSGGDELPDKEDKDRGSHQQTNELSPSNSKPCSSQQKSEACAESLSAPISRPENVTPLKTTVSFGAGSHVTPVKLFLIDEQSNTTKSPRRKKPKTPKKRTSDVQISPTSTMPAAPDEALPIFKQILTDTRLHEKLAETCNLVSGQLKHSGSNSHDGSKSKDGESSADGEHTITQDELETITASKSLEEILDMDTNFATELEENINMADPAFESLFKLFGTDKESFSESIKKEKKKTEEMTAEVEELEKSVIHDIYKQYVSSPASVATQPFSPYAPTTPQLFSPQSDHTDSVSDCSYINPHLISTPRQHCMTSGDDQSPLSEIRRRLMTSTPTQSSSLTCHPYTPSNAGDVENFAVPNNCSPLVGTELQSNNSAVDMHEHSVYTPQAKKCIFNQFGTNGAFSSPQTDISVSALPTSSYASDNNRDVTLTPYTAGEYQESPCSTIENTIGCISLPQPAVEVNAGNQASTDSQSKQTTKSNKSTKKGKAKTSKSTESEQCATLKNILAQPVLHPVLDGDMMPKTPEPQMTGTVDSSNQNIVILSPGGTTSYSIPLLACEDDASGKLTPLSKEEAETISLWGQDLNVPSEYSISTENQATHSLVNAIISGNSANILQQIQATNSTESQSSEAKSKKTKTGKSSKRKRKSADKDVCEEQVHDKQENSAGVFNVDGGILTATPLQVAHTVQAKPLDFGPDVVEAPNFRKIAPKPNSSGTIIIVNNSSSTVVPDTSNAGLTGAIQDLPQIHIMKKEDAQNNDALDERGTQKINKNNSPRKKEDSSSVLRDVANATPTNSSPKLSNVQTNDGLRLVDSIDLTLDDASVVHSTKLRKYPISDMKEAMKNSALKSKSVASKAANGNRATEKSKSPLKASFSPKFSRLSLSKRVKSKAAPKTNIVNGKSKETRVDSVEINVDEEGTSAVECSTSPDVTPKKRRRGTRTLKVKILGNKQGRNKSLANSDGLLKVNTLKKPNSKKIVPAESSSEDELPLSVLKKRIMEVRKPGAEKEDEEKLKSVSSPKQTRNMALSEAILENNKLDTRKGDGETSESFSSPKKTINIPLSKTISEHKLDTGKGDGKKLKSFSSAKTHNMPLSKTISKVTKPDIGNGDGEKLESFSSPKQSHKVPHSKTVSKVNKSDADTGDYKKLESSSSPKETPNIPLSKKLLEVNKPDAENRDCKKLESLNSPKKTLKTPHSKHETAEGASDNNGKSVDSDRSPQTPSPSKEMLLGKVGLTPTKELIDHSLLSPSRPDPLDVLAEWQCSPVSSHHRRHVSNSKTSFRSPGTPRRKSSAKKLFNTTPTKIRSPSVKKDMAKYFDSEIAVGSVTLRGQKRKPITTNVGQNDKSDKLKPASTNEGNVFSLGVFGDKELLPEELENLPGVESPKSAESKGVKKDGGELGCVISGKNGVDTNSSINDLDLNDGKDVVPSGSISVKPVSLGKKHKHKKGKHKESKTDKEEVGGGKLDANSSINALDSSNGKDMVASGSILVEPGSSGKKHKHKKSKHNESKTDKEEDYANSSINALDLNEGKDRVASSGTLAEPGSSSKKHKHRKSEHKESKTDKQKEGGGKLDANCSINALDLNDGKDRVASGSFLVEPGSSGKKHKKSEHKESKTDQEEEDGGKLDASISGITRVDVHSRINDGDMNNANNMVASASVLPEHASPGKKHKHKKSKLKKKSKHKDKKHKHHRHHKHKNNSSGNQLNGANASSETAVQNVSECLPGNIAQKEVLETMSDVFSAIHYGLTDRNEYNVKNQVGDDKLVEDQDNRQQNQSISAIDQRTVSLEHQSIIETNLPLNKTLQDNTVTAVAEDVAVNDSLEEDRSSIENVHSSAARPRLKSVTEHTPEQDAKTSGQPKTLGSNDKILLDSNSDAAENLPGITMKSPKDVHKKHRSHEKKKSKKRRRESTEGESVERKRHKKSHHKKEKKSMDLSVLNIDDALSQLYSSPKPTSSVTPSVSPGTTLQNNTVSSTEPKITVSSTEPKITVISTEPKITSD